MSLSVTIVISGDKKAIQMLKDLGGSFSNFSGAMRDIGDEVSKYFSGPAFASQGGVFGEQWPRLSPVYALWKAHHYPGRGINVRTGKTQRSFVYRADRKSVLLTNSNDDVFEFLQLGTRKMAARPMIGINSDVTSMVQRIMQADVEQKILRARSV